MTTYRHVAAYSTPVNSSGNTTMELAKRVGPAADVLLRLSHTLGVDVYVLPPGSTGTSSATVVPSGRGAAGPLIPVSLRDGEPAVRAAPTASGAINVDVYVPR